MAAANVFTWGSLATPVNGLMAQYGVDSHVGFDVLVTAGLLMVLAFFGGRKFRKSDMVEPSGKLDFSTFFEVVIGGMYSFMKNTIGDLARPMFFLTGSFAFFILFNNLMSVIPGFNPPTDQFNVTIVLALISFLAYNVLGIREHGFGYIKQFLGPAWYLAWLMLPIELISHCVRPLSLALRLFGNITGDHKVGAVFFGLVPFIVPLPFLGLGLFVAGMQTFVFLLLTLVYIQMAVSHDH
ncbi:MAG: F0F1 ATP synthase subunit A [Proteobacteria bacterium]|nr:F0F1 ATP synthase subunit A [Pseudomonadota bacterium]